MAATRTFILPPVLNQASRQNLSIFSPSEFELQRRNFQRIALQKSRLLRYQVPLSRPIVSKWILHDIKDKASSRQEKVLATVTETGKFRPAKAEKDIFFAAKAEILGLKLAGIFQEAVTATAGAVCAVLIFASSPLSAFAEPETNSFTITFPASTIPEVSRVQRTLVEAWAIIEETFWDSSFNNQDWEEQLSSGLFESLSYRSADEVYTKVRGMLATLGDPFTRIVTPQEYQAFRITNDGALEGVGLLISAEPDTGRLIVLTPIEGGPAARAGIHSGDEIVQIDDEDLAGITEDEAAILLRGRAGTEVNLTVRRPVEGSYDQASSAEGELTHVHLKRETITLSPVFAMMLQHADESGHNVQTGYIRLTSFSQNAAEDMEKAVIQLEKDGANNYILDLRNNPGGLVRAGLEIAQIWLNGNESLVNTIDRSGTLQNISLMDTHALTHQPLAVLVNKGSASASEILAGALHDNGRATLIGDNTYGKGKIQSVFELNDGSALFVTVAKYLSPKLHQIDQVGIAPDLHCTVEIPASNIEEVPEVPLIPEPKKNSPLKQALILQIDPTLLLQSDSCVLTAEKQLIGS